MTKNVFSFVWASLCLKLYLVFYLLFFNDFYFLFFIIYLGDSRITLSPAMFYMVFLLLLNTFKIYAKNRPFRYQKNSEIRKIPKSEKCLVSRFSVKRLWICITTTTKSLNYLGSVLLWLWRGDCNMELEVQFPLAS